MTEAKAKLYKTATIARDTDDFRTGEIVAVEHLGRGAFGLNFRVTLGKRSAVLSDADLTDFVL